MKITLSICTFILLGSSVCFASPTCGGAAAGKSHTCDNGKENCNCKNAENDTAKHDCDCKDCQEGKHMCGDKTKGCGCNHSSDKSSCKGDACAKE